MLAQTLQWLESDGFVLRVEHPVQPPHVDYRLTPLGREVGRHVRELFDWIEGKLPAILDARGRQGGPDDDQPSSRPKKRIVRS